METRHHCSGAGGGGGRAGGRPPRREARLWLGSRLCSFFVHYLFRFARGPAARAGAPGQGLLPLAGVTDEKNSGTSAPGKPRGATGKGGDPGRALAAGSRLLAGDFPRPRLRLHSPPGSWARGAALPPRARGQAWPGATAPCTGYQRAAPGPPPRPPRRPKPRANFCSSARRSSPAREARPPPRGARAVVRVRTEAPPRGRGTGEAAGFKWGPPGGSGQSLRRGERVLLFPARRIRWGRRQARWSEALEGHGRRWRPGGSARPGAGGWGSLGGARQGKWSAHGDAYVAACAVRAGGAKRVHAACGFMVLCMQGQRVCRQQPVGVHAGYEVCSQWE